MIERDRERGIEGNKRQTQGWREEDKKGDVLHKHNKKEKNQKRNF